MAIDYALAKELCDAGFPQGGEGRWTSPPDKIVARREDRVYAPTLSELIEACGAEFGALQKEGDTWSAKSVTAPAGDYATGFGATPEEAVARLWLALYKKL
jgi:hypothetical protein